MYFNATDLFCPMCRSADRVYMASSYREKLQLPRQSAHEPLAAPFGPFMFVYLLASLQFLAGSVYKQLPGWPSALSTMNDLLPKPQLSVAIGAAILLVALDRPTRAFLRHMGKAAALDSRLYRALDGRASSLALGMVPVGVASFGWAVFLGLKSVDSWLAVGTGRTTAGPDWVPMAVQGFLAGGLVVLAGFPLMVFVMSRTARVFAEFGDLERDDVSFGEFARNLAYPYGLLPVGMGLAMSSGLQLLSVAAICWFLAATFVAARHTLKQNTELAVPVALLGTVPVILGFFFVALRIQTNALFPDWASVRDQTSILPDLGSFWLVGTLAVAGLLAFAARLAAALTRRINARTNLARQEAAMPWHHLLYCERCNGVHLPKQKEFVPASEVGRLLLGLGE